jgi:transposase InsO family protein
MTEDEKDIINIFERKKQKAGYRTLKMIFERKNKKLISLKKVRRIKRDFNLVTKIRRRSKFRALNAKGVEHSVAPNLVQRHFEEPNLILVDITEMKIRGGQRTYLFAMKNALTREIVGFDVSTRPSLVLVTDTVETYLKSAPKELMFHSDQGVHFTCAEYRNVLKRWNVIQSMSRKGNCLDNAPIESFFGHLKDELDYKDCKTIGGLKRKLKNYIHYYNNERPQWSLKQKTPAEAGVKLSLVY